MNNIREQAQVAPVIDSVYHCAVITGASSGLGSEYVRQLAPFCKSLILVARRGDLLAELQAELKELYSDKEVICLTADLTKEESRLGLFKAIEQLQLQPDLLVNNAGMGDYGSFTSADWSKLDSMMRLNMTALTHLCHGFLPGMLTRFAEGMKGGAIINVSSLASMLPIPDFAVYAASKAYVTNFSEALRLELKEFNIPVLAVCPGPVHTGFGQVAMREEYSDKLPSREGFYTSPEQVVSDSIKALHERRARVFPGWKIALLAAGISVLPMAILRGLLTSRR